MESGGGGGGVPWPLPAAQETGRLGSHLHSPLWQQGPRGERGPQGSSGEKGDQVSIVWEVEGTSPAAHLGQTGGQGQSLQT